MRLKDGLLKDVIDTSIVKKERSIEEIQGDLIQTYKEHIQILLELVEGKDKMIKLLKNQSLIQDKYIDKFLDEIRELKIKLISPLL